MDINTLSLAKKHTDQEIEKVNQTINQITSGIKSITANGSILTFTLSDNSQISVTLTGLSDNNYTTIDKNKLQSIDTNLINKFSYNGAQLLFDSQPIEGTVDLSNYATKNGDVNNDFSANNVTVKGNIMPSANGTQDIGSPDNRFKTIYVDEAKLSTNTLYIGDTPVLGTNQDTIVIKGDIDQSVTMKTSGVGTTKVISGSGVELSTSGMNANVTIQATGSGSNANLGATNQINLTAPSVNLNGNTSVDSLTVRGNLIVNGGTTTVNSTTVQVADNIMELNKNEVGYGVTAGRAGIKIDRGDADAQLLIFDETDKNFKIGTDTSLQSIATQNYVDNKTPIKTSQLTNDSGFLTSIPSNYAKINDNGITGDTTETYSIDKIISLLSNKQNKLYLQNTQPSSPIINDIWINNTSSPYIMNVYNGTSFVQVGSSSNGVGITDWTSSTNYVANTSFVIYNNLLYRCTVTHTSGTSLDLTKWQYIGNTDTKSINGIIVDDSNRSNGRGLFYNQSTNKLEYANVNITGIVGSSTLTTVSNTTIASGAEVTFNHPVSTNIIPVIEEQIAGSSVTDTHVDFSDSSKYALQDNGKILAGNNKTQLDIYTKLLMHMDDSSFTDICGHTVTNSGVVFDTSTYKFGTGSAYFNGSSSYLNIPNNTDFNLGTTFTIDFWFYSMGTNSNSFFLANTNGAATSSGFAVFTSGGKLWIAGTTGNGSWNNGSISIAYSFTQNIWYHIAIVNNNGTVTIYINGNSIVTGLFPSNTSTNPLRIGADTSLTSGSFISGKIDELRISKGIARWTSNFTVPNIFNGIPYIIVNTPIYLQTTGISDYSLTTIDTITSLTIPVTTTANSTVKCLFSVDNKQNWLYYNGISVQKFNGDITQDWGSNSSLYTQLQTYFTNKTIASLTSDLSSLGITSITTLDLMFQLNTTNLNETPSISPITMVYTTTPHNEFASIGTFSDSSTYGVKRVSNSQLSVKNKSALSKVIRLNVITSA